jgi:hypothetical protein
MYLAKAYLERVCMTLQATPLLLARSITSTGLDKDTYRTSLDSKEICLQNWKQTLVPQIEYYIHKAQRLHVLRHLIV